MKSYHKNPRKITEKELTKLKNSILDLGDISGIIHDIGTDEIISGNQRCKVIDVDSCEKNIVIKYETPDKYGTLAVGYIKWNDVLMNYRRVLWTAEQRDRACVFANAVGGDWDFKVLKTEWDADLLRSWDLKDIKANFKKEVVEDDFDSENQSANSDIVVNVGDVFEIEYNGYKHILQCGDSTKKTDIDRLLDGRLANIVFTDPPFDMDDEYSDLIFASTSENCHIFIMNSDKNIALLINRHLSYFSRLFAVDFKAANLISNNMPMTRVDYIAEFKKGKNRFKNLMDGFSTLVECHKSHGKKSKNNFGHSQAKKVELPSMFIQHYSDEDDIVLDVFGGSGTTLIAAMQLNRTCYIQEFDPTNCAIIINRVKSMFQNATINKK